MHLWSIKAAQQGNEPLKTLSAGAVQPFHLKCMQKSEEQRGWFCTSWCCLKAEDQRILGLLCPRATRLQKGLNI